MKRLVVPRSHFNLSGDAEGEVIANAGLVDAPLGELVLVTQTRRAIMKLENGDDDLEKRARADVAAILGQSVPIRASTLAEAIAEAERLKATENILLAQNSLWNWFNALPTSEREKVGQFRGKRHFWIAIRFRNRPQ